MTKRGPESGRPLSLKDVHKKMVIANIRVKTEFGGPDGDCLEWTGTCDSKGRGKMTVMRKSELIYRLSFAAFHEEITPEMVIRHKCDNPRCCNPYHLEVGTQAENMQDMKKRGRSTANYKIRAKSNKQGSK